MRLKTSSEVTEAISLSQRRQQLDTALAAAATAAAKRLRKSRKSMYRGVFWEPDTNLWVARVKSNGKVRKKGTINVNPFFDLHIQCSIIVGINEGCLK